MTRNILVSTLLISLLVPTISISLDCDTVETTEIKAKEYWYYYALGMVRDIKEDKVFVYGNVPNHHCISPIKIKKAKLQNRQAKEEAFIEILYLKIYQLHRDRSIYDRQQKQDTSIRNISKYVHGSDRYKPMKVSPNFLHIVSTITGKDIETDQEWINWWIENHKYLKLSPDKLHLVVDQEAKQNVKVIQNFSLKKPVNVSADYYWYNEGMGYFQPNRYSFRELKDKGEYFIWDHPGMHESYETRVTKVSLSERNSKEDGYKRALENLITSLDDMLDLQYKGHIVEHKIKTLKRITDQNFATRTEWINWYQVNKSDIVLSYDGKKLVLEDTN